MKKAYSQPLTRWVGMALEQDVATESLPVETTDEHVVTDDSQVFSNSMSRGLWEEDSEEER